MAILDSGQGLRHTLIAIALLAGWPAALVAQEAAAQANASPSDAGAPTAGSAEDLFLQAVATGDLAAAADQFRTCLKAHPSFIPARRALDVIDDHEAGRVDAVSAAAVLEGQGLLFRQEWTLARKRLRDAVEAAPDYAAAWHDLGRACFELGRMREAFDVYQTALRLKPDSVYTLNNLGLVYIRLDDGDRAIEHIRRALEIDPGYCNARNNLGWVLRYLGREDEARQTFKDTLAICPDNARAEANLAWHPPSWVQPAGSARGRAAATTSQATNETPTRVLLGRLTSKKGQVRTEAAEQLVQRHDLDALPRLLRLLDHRREGVRCVAARVLGGLGDSRAFDALVRTAREDRSWVVRIEATSALALLSDEAVTATLVGILSDDGAYQVRHAAALGLCSRPGCPSARAFQKALKDRASEVRVAAEYCLKRASALDGPSDPAAWEDWVATLCGAEPALA